GLLVTYGPHGITPIGAPGTKFYLMALNGGGTTAAGIRNLKNGVDVLARAQTSLLKGTLDAGGSGYYGQLPVRSGPPVGGVPTGFALGVKELVGADLNYKTPWKTTLRAEWVGGVYESSPNRELFMENNHAQGWYASARHPLSKKLEA